MVTMSDVARAAGVSAMTVSNVINGKSGATEATRTRVLTVAAQLGYELNLAARELRSGRTGTIGLFVPSIEGAYFSALAANLTRHARAGGRYVAIEAMGTTAESELAAIQGPRLRNYAGVVLSIVRLDLDTLRDVLIPVPAVFLGERPMPTGFDHVMMDNVEGAALATRRLIDGGARRIAVIGGERDLAGASMEALRSQGYRRALDTAGISFDPRLIVQVTAYGMADGYRAIRALTDEGVAFDAVFALTDPVAIGAIRALADLGIRVPEDVQVVGFDNVPETDFSIPRLTSVDPATTKIAESVLEMLIGRMDGDITTPPRTVTPSPAVLVERESTR
jgi:DNA-binding LacI/PurR family transcriptional regulator